MKTSVETHAATGARQTDPRILYETLIVLALTLLPWLFYPPLKGILSFLPVIYLLVERSLRKRSWAELGFKFGEFKQAFAQNWHLFLLVSVVIQAAVVFIAKAFVPELLAHIQTRVPMLDAASLVPLFIMLPIATLAEELAYRSLFQERLSWFIKTPMAIALVSVVFGLMHWSSGPAWIVAIDLLLVLLDSAIYGLIYSRGRNVLVAWLAHLLADVVAVVLILVV